MQILNLIWRMIGHSAQPHDKGCRSHLSARTTIISMLTLALLNLPAVLAAAPNRKGVELLQFGKQLGSQRTVITDDVLLWSAKGTGFTVIMDKKSTRVTTINDLNKRYMTMTLDNIPNLSKSPVSENYTDRIKKGKHGVIAGVPATQYFVQVKERPMHNGLRRVMDFADRDATDLFSAFAHRQTRTHNKELNRYLNEPAEVWVADDLRLDTKFGNAMRKLSNIPTQFGMVLRLYDSHREKVLDTTKVTRKQFPNTIFEVPPYCKRVTNEVALLMEDANSNEKPSLFSEVSVASHGFTECVLPINKSKETASTKIRR